LRDEGESGWEGETTLGFAVGEIALGPEVVFVIGTGGDVAEYNSALRYTSERE
jgi:hypothetical protein